MMTGIGGGGGGGHDFPITGSVYALYARNTKLAFVSIETDFIYCAKVKVDTLQTRRKTFNMKPFELVAVVVILI
jgi:hypothetical protein